MHDGVYGIVKCEELLAACPGLINWLILIDLVIDWSWNRTYTGKQFGACGTVQCTFLVHALVRRIGLYPRIPQPCFIMTNEVSIRCQKNNRGWYTAYIRVYPQNAPLQLRVLYYVLLFVLFAKRMSWQLVSSAKSEKLNFTHRHYYVYLRHNLNIKVVQIGKLICTKFLGSKMAAP